MAYTNNFSELKAYLNDINVKYEENSAPMTTDSKVKVEEGYCKEEYTEKQDNQSKTLVMSILQYQTGFPAYSMPLQPVLQENMLVKGEYDTNLDIKQEDEGLASKATSAGNSSETSLLLPKSKKIRKQKQPIKSSPKEKEEKKATTKSKSKAPRKKKAIWSHEDDSRALELLAQMGPKWTKIGRIIGGRSGKQVRDRYMQNLKPNINFEKWTKEEDALIMALYSELGSKWLLIAEHLPNRTDNQVKNRFNGKLVHYMPEKPVEKIEEDVKTETDVKVEQS